MEAVTDSKRRLSCSIFAQWDVPAINLGQGTAEILQWNSVSNAGTGRPSVNTVKVERRLGNNTKKMGIINVNAHAKVSQHVSETPITTKFRGIRQHFCRETAQPLDTIQCRASSVLPALVLPLG